MIIGFIYNVGTIDTVKDVHIAPGKRGIHIIFFLISPQKHMLWVLIRSASLRHF